MANNVEVLDGSGLAKTVKTTDNSGVHTPHHIIDGTVAVSFGAGLPAGTNNIGDVDVLSVVPGTGATSLGKAEDSIHTTGDVGVMALVVRRDGDTSIGTPDGDYMPLLVDELGFLKVRGRLATTVLPTMNTQTSGAYADNDFVGAKLTLANVVPIAAGSGVIQMVKVFSKSPQTVTYDVVLFNADPTNSTITDNAAGSIADADLTKIIGVAHCTDITDLGAGSVAMATALGFPFKLASGTTAYACVIVRDALTQTSTSDMILAVDVLPD